MIKASVVVATYNRKEPLANLLATLANQTVPREEYEVVVVDDGSRIAVTDVTGAFSNAMQLTVIRQDNAGVAVARQRGVERARGQIVVFLDDDMLAREDFVAQHIAAHDGHADRVVMGELLPASHVASMPLFERYHAHQLQKMARRYTTTGTFSGHDVYTGNLSLSRELFFRAGGFDPAFHIEDVELGVRLEKVGARFVFSPLVATVHASDHSSLDTWLARSARDGRDWVRLVRKHPTVHEANPWRFLARANPLARPFLAAGVVAPGAARGLARLLVRGARAVDALGFPDATVSAMTIVYGIQYYAGVREETGSLRAALDDYRAFLRTSAVAA